VGKEILIDREPRMIIGILPADFHFPDWGSLSSPDVVAPLLLDPSVSERGAYFLRAIGRLEEDRSLPAAHEELGAIAARLASLYPETNGHRIATVVPLKDIVVGSASGQLWILLGVAGFVLLLACANAGGLLLARNLTRDVEMAIRASLGAGRARLIRQLLTETMVLAVVGGGLGLLLAQWGVDFFAQVLPRGLLQGTPIGIDGLVVQVTLALTLFTCLLSGLAPAFAASGLRAGRNLRNDSRLVTTSRARARLLSSMVVLQLALTFILLDGAGLMVQSLREATGNRELTDPEDVMLAAYLHPQEYRGEIILPDPFLEQFLEMIRALPGVTHAGATTTLPLQGAWTSSLLAEGETYDPDRDRPATHMNPVSPGFLEAMGIELLRGRDLTLEDASGEVLGVVVNQAFVDRSWPDEDPIGKRIRDHSPSDSWFEARVVGVVENVRQNGLESAPQAGMYLPFFPPFHSDRWVAVRTEGDPLAIAPALRRTLAELDPHRPIARLLTADQLFASLARSRTATTRLFGLFAVVAICLAAVGTFGLMSFLVGQKSREIGVRVALGARKGQVTWMVLRKGSAVVTVGAVLGLLGFWGVSSVLQNLLFGVAAMDLGFLGLAAVLLGMVGLSAALLPALKAARTDPVEVINAE
jgi:putative ABC transport system permease protein